MASPHTGSHVYRNNSPGTVRSEFHGCPMGLTCVRWIRTPRAGLGRVTSVYLYYQGCGACRIRHSAIAIIIDSLPMYIQIIDSVLLPMCILVQTSFYVYMIHYSAFSGRQLTCVTLLNRADMDLPDLAHLLRRFSCLVIVSRMTDVLANDTVGLAVHQI